MKEKLVQSLTAYECRICKKYSSLNLLEKSEKNDKPINLTDLLMEFFNYIKVCKIDKYTKRAILLSSSAVKSMFNKTITKIHIQPNAGKALENFSVVNYDTNKVNQYNGSKHSAVYTHNAFFFIDGEKNVFVFHRYGQSGCKTAFLNTFNEFLSQKGLSAHLDVLLSGDMFQNGDRYIPEKISLITTYDELSTDKADNIGEKPKKKVEQETIISLAAPRAKNIKEWIKNISEKSPTIDELKSVLIKDNFSDDFEDAKLTLKFGKVRRRVSLSEFSGLIAEYDITEKLEINGDGTVSMPSLNGIVDEYVMSFLK